MGMSRFDRNMMAQSRLVSDPVEKRAISVLCSAGRRSKACLPMVLGRLRC